MTRIKRKWEWIEDVCKANGYEIPAILAAQIDKHLLDIYGDIHTESWIKEYKDDYDSSPETYDIDDIEWIAFDSVYCIACEIHSNPYKDSSCPQCIFARRAGECDSNQNDSLYDKFRNELDVVKFQ